MKHFLSFLLFSSLALASSAGGGRDVRMNDHKDSVSSALMVLDYAHHEIHSGSNFRVQYNDSAISAAASMCIAFNVADQAKNPHMIFEWEAESIATITLTEGVTITASTGTDRVVKNSRRDSANTSVLQGYATGSWVSNNVTIDPTITGGTAISVKKVYSTSRTGGGGGSRRAEIILKTDEEYSVCCQNNDTSDKGCQLRLEWYEHADS